MAVQTPPPPIDIPATAFGSTGRTVTRVGLGGEGILRSYGREDEAVEVVGEALGQGFTYFDSARAYAESEIYLGAMWREFPQRRAGIFQTSKSASRGRDAALRDLDETLANLATDHLDLWQIHDVRTLEDIRAIEAPGGALEAFQEAKAAGRVRHIGVTGHHDPAILTRCVREWPVDSVLLPVNPVEGALGGFLTETVPAARARGLAVVGMKALGGGGPGRPGNYTQLGGGVTPGLLVRYALSKDVDVVIVGCSTYLEVRALSEAAHAFSPFAPHELAEIEAAFLPHARQLAFYRGGYVGREGGTRRRRW